MAKMRVSSIIALVFMVLLYACKNRECSEAELTDFIGAVQELQNAEDYAQMEKSCVHVRDEFVTFRNKDIGTVSKNRILKLLGKPEEVTCNIDYRRSLIPRYLGWVDYETATKVDPDIVTWRGVARDWEFVPYSTTQKLCEYLSVKTGGKVVATYHRKIKRIVPYSFHEAYGTIVFEDVDDDKIYIYSYDKRYSPSFE